MRGPAPKLPGWVVPAAAALVAFALRAAGASHYWINADEGIYYAVASAPTWAERWSAIAGNAHPPLHYLLLVLIRSVTDDALWLRAPSVLFGALAVPALYALVRALAGRGAGGIAAWGLALSPGAVMLSQTARPYGLQLFLLAIALLCLLRGAQSRERRWLAGYAVSALLAVLHHYSSLIALGTAGLCVGAAGLRGALPPAVLARIALASAPAALAAALVAWLHLVPALRAGFPEGAVPGWLTPYYAQGPRALAALWLGAVEYLTGAALAAPVLLVWLGALALALAQRRWLLAGASLALIAAASLLSLLARYPLGCTRHDLYLALALFPLLGTGLAQALLAGPLARRALALGCLALALLARDPLARALGRPPGPWRAHPELGLARSEVEGWLAPRLAALAKTPGLLLMDQFTSYTLLPLFARDPSRPDAGARPLGFADEHALRVLDFGARKLVVAAAWFLSASPRDRDAEHGLWRQLERLRDERRELAPLLSELRVVSANGPHLVLALRRRASERHTRPDRVPPRARGLGRGAIVSEVELQPPALALFRLDARELHASGPWRSPSGIDPDSQP